MRRLRLADSDPAARHARKLAEPADDGETGIVDRLDRKIGLFCQSLLAGQFQSVSNRGDHRQREQQKRDDLHCREHVVLLDYQLEERRAA